MTVALAVALSHCVAACAVEQGMVVVGKGIAEARPDLAEIKISNTGQAELSADAVLKCRSARQSTIEALKGLAMPALAIEPLGVAFNSTDLAQQEGYSEGQTAVKPQTIITRQLRLRLTGIDQLDEEKLIDTLATILDTVKDSGAAILPAEATNPWNQGETPGASVVFKLAHPEALRRQALQNAIADARGQAEELAQLAALKIESMVTLGEDDSASEVAAMALFTDSDPFQSAHMDKIRVTVTLRVRFSFANKN